MVVTQIVLKSAIATNRDRLLGVVVIANVGGTATSGTYEVCATRPGGRMRTVKIEGFPRKAKSGLELLRRALNALHDAGDLP